MAGMDFHGDLSDLRDDLQTIAVESKKRMRDVVRDGVKAGAMLAKDNARISAGEHGKHYPNAITGSLHGGLGLFGNVVSGEYGPDSDLPQGDMSFEHGSRNQKPHLDLARSADIIGPSFAQEVRDMAEDLFWPGAST